VRILKTAIAFLAVLVLPVALLPFSIGPGEIAIIGILAILAGYITYQRSAPKTERPGGEGNISA
jgi:hypothetical protein